MSSIQSSMGVAKPSLPAQSAGQPQAAKFGSGAYGVISDMTQRMLSQSGNVSYLVRGVYRVGVTQDDRKMDYLLRDFYTPVMTAYLTELGFRWVGEKYTVPLFRKYLGLEGPEFANVSKETWRHVDDMFRKRVSSTLARDKSNDLIATLYEKIDLENKKSPGQTEGARLLVERLRQRLNYPEHLRLLAKKEALEELSPDDLAKGVDDGLQAIRKNLKAQGFAEVDQLKMHESVFDLRRAGTHASDEIASALEQQKNGGTLRKMFEAFETEKAAVLEKHEGKAAKWVREGLEHGVAQDILKKVQKSGSWPKMVASVVLTLIMQSAFINPVDVYVIQPWQEKIFKQRGTTADTVTPAYWALIPGLAAFGVAQKLFRKKGYLGGFAIAGLLGCVTYTGTAVAMIKQRLSKPPKNMPAQGNPQLAAQQPPKQSAVGAPQSSVQSGSIQQSAVPQGLAQPSPVFQRSFQQRQLTRA